MKILVSGFEPFGGHESNSSEIIARELGRLPGYRTIILPVTFERAFEVLKKEIDLYHPDLVVSLGLADKRQKIEIEKVAINLLHCEIPDNNGVVYRDQKILPEGPDAYFATLPVLEMSQVPTSFSTGISFSAGAYVCNYVMYRTLDYLKDSNTKAGFIHLPQLNDNKNEIIDTIREILERL